ACRPAARYPGAGPAGVRPPGARIPGPGCLAACCPRASGRRAPGRRPAHETGPAVRAAELQGGDVVLLGTDGLGRGAQGGQLVSGQVALDHPADAGGADLGLDAEVDAVDAVLAVDP